MIRLYDQLKVFRDKTQHIYIKDGENYVISDTPVGDVPMKYTSRNVFGVFFNDDKTVTITLENQIERKPRERK